jgi:hypothetical protein
LSAAASFGKNGLTLAQSFSAGGWNFEFSFDEVENEAKLGTKGALPIKADNQATAQVLAGLLMQVVNVIQLCISALNKTGNTKAKQLGSSLALVKNKIASNITAVTASFKPAGIKTELGIEVELLLCMEGKGEFSITVANVIEDNQWSFEEREASIRRIRAFREQQPEAALILGETLDQSRVL